LKFWLSPFIRKTYWPSSDSNKKTGLVGPVRSVELDAYTSQRGANLSADCAFLAEVSAVLCAPPRSVQLLRERGNGHKHKCKPRATRFYIHYMTTSRYIIENTGYSWCRSPSCSKRSSNLCTIKQIFRRGDPFRRRWRYAQVGVPLLETANAWRGRPSES
jgi:hypothetical protein